MSAPTTTPVPDNLLSSALSSHTTVTFAFDADDIIGTFRDGPKSLASFYTQVNKAEGLLTDPDDEALPIAWPATFDSEEMALEMERLKEARYTKEDRRNATLDSTKVDLRDKQHMHIGSRLYGHMLGVAARGKARYAAATADGAEATRHQKRVVSPGAVDTNRTCANATRRLGLAAPRPSTMYPHPLSLVLSILWARAFTSGAWTWARDYTTTQRGGLSDGLPSSRRQRPRRRRRPQRPRRRRPRRRRPRRRRPRHRRHRRRWPLFSLRGPVGPSRCALLAI